MPQLDEPSSTRPKRQTARWAALGAGQGLGATVAVMDSGAAAAAVPAGAQRKTCGF
jgi:hypothetical protein